MEIFRGGLPRPIFLPCLLLLQDGLRCLCWYVHTHPSKAKHLPNGSQVLKMHFTDHIAPKNSYMIYFVANGHVGLAHIMGVREICPLVPINQCQAMEAFDHVSCQSAMF